MSGSQKDQDAVPKREGPGKSDGGSGKGGGGGGKARSHRSNDVGRALRSVYDDTLRESVPDDFLDLLGKLG